MENSNRKPVNPLSGKYSKNLSEGNFFLNAQLRNIQIFILLLITIFLNRSLSKLEKIIIFNLLLLKHVDIALFKKLSTSETDFFHHSLPSSVPISSNEKYGV